jgi:hypothetical protein
MDDRTAILRTHLSLLGADKMSQTFEYCEERALAAEASAATAALANVRERDLRSAQVWREMADQARVTRATRAIDQDRIKRRAEAESLA